MSTAWSPHHKQYGDVHGVALSFVPRRAKFWVKGVEILKRLAKLYDVATAVAQFVLFEENRATQPPARFLETL